MPTPDAKWTPLPDPATRRIEAPGLTVRQIVGLSQRLVGGDLAAAAMRIGVDPQGVGALGLATGPRYSVRLARDRMLVVGADPAVLPAGWDPAGFAVTPIDGGLAVFEIAGPRAEAIVARATTLPVAQAGPSAAVVFAGLAATLYRHDRPDTLRLHVDRGLGAFVWDWLEAQIAVMDAVTVDP